MKAGKILSLGLCMSFCVLLSVGCGSADTEKKAPDSGNTSVQNEQESSEKKDEASSQESETKQKDTEEQSPDKTESRSSESEKTSKTDDAGEGDPEEPAKNSSIDKTAESESADSAERDSEESEDAMAAYAGQWKLDGGRTQENAAEDIFVTFGSGLRSNGASLTISKEGREYKAEAFVGVGLEYSGRVTLDDSGKVMKFVGQKTLEKPENVSFDIQVKELDGTVYLTFEEYDTELYFTK